ncbi:MAG: glycosyltransferase family 4 protein [Acidobacteria bacterium]|nr:glycosyltransferase family 4 protein [Acidobacteriota bacterium]
MRILSLTAGAASMYCGSCLRDNNLAAELRRMGHDITLVPLYTPTRTDEPSESAGAHILFGGISVYLQNQSALFRHTPAWLDRIWDSQWALNAAAKRSIAVDAESLGAMTVAMLEGAQGPIAREFRKLEHWLALQASGGNPPDVVTIPNTLLISLAPAIRRVYRGPIVCTMQGEDLFLNHLLEPYQSRALDLIRRQAQHVDAFIAISQSYAALMARLLEIPPAKIFAVPPGVDPARFQPARPSGTFRAGYLARIAPEKGLHLLCESWRLFREQFDGPAELHAAGYLAPEHAAYLEPLRATPDFHYHGELDLQAKVDYLASLDAFCVPSVYDDPKALYLLEALASAVPAVAPRRMALAEHLEACGGGLLVEPDSAPAIAAALLRLARDPSYSRRLGFQGREGVSLYRTLRQMAENTLEVYTSLPTPSAIP